MDDEQIRYALKAIHKTLEQLKVSQDATAAEVSKITVALEKQNFFSMDAGAIISSINCQEHHTTIDKKIQEVQGSVSSRIKATWAVLIFILGGYGLVTAFIAERVFGQ